MLAGASCVQVGTATMVDPTAIGRIASEMGEYVDQYNYASVSDVVGGLLPH